MNRIANPDAGLNALNEDRDHLAVQLSLLADTDSPDMGRLTALRDKLARLDDMIAHYRRTPT